MFENSKEGIMLRSKDFYLKSVFNVNGKKLGVIKDICIDFFTGRVTGLLVTNYSFFSKRNILNVEDILSMDEDIIVNELQEGENLLLLSDIKDMDVIDKNNYMKGVVEDIIVDTLDFNIKGIIINSGFIQNIISGKEILLLNRCILGEDYILYLGDIGIVMKTIPHNIAKNEYNKKA